MKGNKWLRLVTYVTGLVNQELLLQNEYLAAENRILRAHLPARLRLSDPERSTLAEIGKQLVRFGLLRSARQSRSDLREIPVIFSSVDSRAEMGIRGFRSCQREGR